MLIEHLGPLEGAGRMVSFQPGEFNLILLSLPHTLNVFLGKYPPESIELMGYRAWILRVEITRSTAGRGWSSD